MGSQSGVPRKKREFGDMIGEDNLNPYKKKGLEVLFKREQSRAKKTESSQNTNYWRNFSSSNEPSVQKDRFQYFSSGILPRQSLARRLS
mmetsp:Transcript_25228/g.19010  ORF Transcript_25228/g.19010 Transcript_25228/m.19010 type:complete len:89 (-) Transcript_25228:182-448(-)